MKLKVLITEEELKIMGITKEELGQIALEQIQDADVRGMRITYQTEIEVEVETIRESEVEQKWSQYTYPALNVKDNKKK